MPRRRCLQHHDWHQSQVVARLRPDVSLASALAQVGASTVPASPAIPTRSCERRCCSTFAERGSRRKCEEAAELDAVRSWLHAADRLPQCLESAGCAGRGTAEGSSDSQRSRSAACHLDSRAVDRERADLRGRWPGRHSAVDTCYAVARACVERPAHRAKHPPGWCCDCVCLRADVRGGAGCRLAARAFDNGQERC